jgi:hypothetical protein
MDCAQQAVTGITGITTRITYTATIATAATAALLWLTYHRIHVSTSAAAACCHDDSERVDTPPDTHPVQMRESLHKPRL